MLVLRACGIDKMSFLGYNNSIYLLFLMLKLGLGIIFGVLSAVMALNYFEQPELAQVSVIGLDDVVEEGSPIVPEVSESDLIIADLEAELAALKVGAELPVGNSSGPVNTFGFEEVPLNAKVGEPVSFKLKALDLRGDTVTNYVGKVRFAASGANAAYVTLPQDYQFTLADQGEHTFALALNFTQAGVYNVKVTDLNNLAVFGEMAITVAASSGLDGPISASAITLSSPLAGIYGENVQTVSGKATPGAGVKVFDNEVEIGSVVADLNGRFSFTTKPLADGQHLMYVAMVNAIGTITEVSAPVAFTVDTEAESELDVSFEPLGNAIPGSAVKVKVIAASKLSSLELVVEGVRTQLRYNVAGFYEGSFAAPMAFGTYEVKFNVVDELGNKSEVVAEEKLVVGSLDFEEKVAPANVTNVVAVAGDRKVSLTWDAVDAGAAGLTNYRVYYGLAPNDLTEAVDTFSVAPNWFVPNLVNGQTYYFAVVAVDERTNVSDQFSNIVMATPVQVLGEMVPVDVMEGAAGADALNDMERDVSEAGPAVWGLLLFSGIAGCFYRKLR